MQVAAKLQLVATCPDTEYDTKFLQGMLNRMSVSLFKYGSVVDAFPHTVDAIKSATQRVQTYLETGNTEFLIDAANFMMIEFMLPSHENAFFKGTDSDQSPGRTTVAGEITTERNEAL